MVSLEELRRNHDYTTAIRLVLQAEENQPAIQYFMKDYHGDRPYVDFVGEHVPRSKRNLFIRDVPDDRIDYRGLDGVMRDLWKQAEQTPATDTE